MDNKYSLSQLAELYSKRSGLTKVQAELFVRSFFKIIQERVLTEESVKIKGLGTFKLTNIDPRASVNVNTGERIIIEGHQRISFLPDAALKKIINEPFSAFETVIISEQQASVLTATGGTDVIEENLEERETGSEQELADEASGPENVVEQVLELDPNTVVDISWRRSRRTALKAALWISSVLLVCVLMLYVLWPLGLLHHLGAIRSNRISGGMGNEKLLTIQSHRLQPRAVNDDLAVILTSAETPDVLSEFEDLPEIADMPEESLPEIDEIPDVELPETGETPGADLPDMETPHNEPAAEAEKPETPEQKEQPVKEEKVGKTEEVSVSTPPAEGITNTEVDFMLTLEDVEKELADFNKGDTVNYIMGNVLTVHTIKSGETLTQVSYKYYGTKKLWPYIAAYNNFTNNNMLYVGMKVKVPQLSNK